MRVLCVIPARGGSKRLPGKNLRKIGGISLVGRAVLSARQFIDLAKLDDALIFVDTDDPEIAREAQQWGVSVPFMRSPDLATDSTPTIDNILAVINRLEDGGEHFDAVILLQPTSPLRTAEDIAACWREFHSLDQPSVVSVSHVNHLGDALVQLTEEGCILPPVIREGESANRNPTVRITGAVYINTVEILRVNRTFVIPGLTRAVVLPEERSVDVDTQTDLALAAALVDTPAS